MIIISFLVTIFVYLISKKIYQHWQKAYFSPLLITPLVLVVLLYLSHLPYATYNSGTKWLSTMLQPATVAFAIPLFKYKKILKAHAPEVFISVFTGSFIAILTSVLLARSMHLTPQIIDSLAPRSITTPLAMTLSKTIGGIPAITAIFVILTGITGLVIGPLVISILPIKNKISQGVLLGTGAHGAGTSKAFEMGSVEGTIASLAMILAAVVTIFLAPFLIPYI